MIELIGIVIIIALVYIIASIVILVLKVLYPYRWLILIGTICIAYYMHQKPSVNAYRRVQFTKCDNKKGNELVYSLQHKGLVRLKSGVHIDGVCNELANQIPIIVDTYRKEIGDYSYRVTITSAIDGKHSQNSHHYKGRAFDLRVRDISHREATKIADKLKHRLGTNYHILWGDRGHKDHIHIAYIGTQ